MRMVSILKATKEITGSLFIRILGYKTNKMSVSTDISGH